MILVLKQTLKNGQSKTWKLRPSQEQYGFGASRLADIISLDPHSPGIEGIFQFKNSQWSYIAMTEACFQATNQPCRKLLQDDEVVVLGSSELKITLLQRDNSYAQQLIKNDYATGSEDGELVIIEKDGRILATRLLQGANQPLEPQWNDPVYKVTRKMIKTEDTQHLAKIGINDVIDKESQRQVGTVLGVTALLVLGGLFGPKNKPELAKLPPKTQSIVIRTEVKPKEKKSEPAPKPQQVAMAPVENAAKPAGRVSDKVKALSGGRMSQLLGKVSAQAAKSANIFVGQGVQAGQGSSGRAVASLGTVDRSGSSFGSGSGSGVTVSTAGRGGGRAVSGMGGLAAGRTGSGGVGLIEEESEISGGLDREVIAQYIKSQLGNILYCYERQLSAQPDLFGKVAVRFTIGPNGGIEAKSIGDSTLKNSTVEGCILQKVAAWKFPSPQGGTRVMVTYPFLFKSTN